MRNVRRIAIVNRGEAARRCLRAIRELRAEEGSDLVGISLYTDPDRLAPFVREADETLPLGAAFQLRDGEPKSVYLDYERIIRTLRAAGADTVWPGWGFVAEHPDFVERLEKEEIRFLGPSSDTMRRLGDKIASKRIAEQAGVPVAPWSGGPLGRGELDHWSDTIGLPLVLKATAGGGGRGIRVVTDRTGLGAAFDSATAEAKAAFGDGTLFAEKRVTGARHVEAQMAADTHGRVLALGLRDCSVQRKHQKVIEEGPPPALSAALREAILSASVRLLETVGYVGVATCEYLVQGDEFFFLEVNPRLQVEHGVTEMLTDFDLVKAQIRIGRGEALPDVAPAERGAAIEVRLCAEDPGAGFAPSPGRILMLDLPAGAGVRVDAGISAGTTVPSEFDSMIAKIIAHGATREEARARLVRAMTDTRVLLDGGTTNKGFLMDVLGHEAFARGGIDTTWLDTTTLARPTPPCAEALLVAAIHAYQQGRGVARQSFFAEASRGRPVNVPASTGTEVQLVYGGVPYRLTVFAMGGFTYRIHDGSGVTRITLLERGPYERLLVMRERRVAVLVSSSEVEIRVEIDGRQHLVQRDVGGRVRAPSPSMLIELAVREGDTVRAGDRLGLFEAMKCETAFHAPTAGVVREVLASAGSRLDAGEVILVIEPTGDASGPTSEAARVALPYEPDPFAAFIGEGDEVDMTRFDALSDVERHGAVDALRSESRRILLGYDVNPTRADRLVEILSAPVASLGATARQDLAEVAGVLQLFGDVEVLFSRSPNELSEDELGPSNDARMAMYLRRVPVQGAGIAEDFLDHLRTALSHYGVASLEPNDTLERFVLRLYSTRTTHGLRSQLATALLNLVIGLAQTRTAIDQVPSLKSALERLWQLRGTVTPAVADLSAQARFLGFDRESEPAAHMRGVDPLETVVSPPPGTDLAPFAEPLGLTLAEAHRFELWRLSNFDLERLEIPGFDGILAVFGRAKGDSGDERLFCFTEVWDLGQGAPARPDLSHFERRFHAAVEAMRSLQVHRLGSRRLHWNRLYVLVRVPIHLTKRTVAGTLRRLAPETGNLGLERVIVRVATLAADGLTPSQKLELLAWNPSGGRVEWSMREPHDRPLDQATPYERRVALARARGQTYPYEVVRLFVSPPEAAQTGVGRPTGSGSFVEYDLVEGRTEPVDRPPGGATSGVVFGVISTPTAKHPEGVRRVLLLSDPTADMGALSAAECDRIVAALELAARETLPVEWVAVSAGARIAMDSGTENLDATARVVRRLVNFTDGGGEVNLVLPGVNVGAQSYFDALATMGTRTRGILVMLPHSSMVLTGKAALQFAGGVSAEDEVGIGGYERIMGPNGEAQYRARDLVEAHGILLEHYATAYVAPGETSPRRFATADPVDRDVTEAPYEGGEGFATLGEIFSQETNPGRKRPFAMRPVMRAVADADAGVLERWRDWTDAQSAIVWDCHIGGIATTLIGVESRQAPRIGYTPNDGPTAWTGATLFPHSSKKVARALNAASGVRPSVILANLSGFDGSPESMRRGVLEMGAEIARAVVRYEGPIAFVVVTRYHGGAYVVFSKELNDGLHASALTGSYASVIGGAAAAAVVFSRDVRKRAQADPRVQAAAKALSAARDPAAHADRRARYDRIFDQVQIEKQTEVAGEFDEVHSVQRAMSVGSLASIIEPSELRPKLVAWLGG